MFLATIGYEGLSTDAFFGELVGNRVQTIVDVRELPLSHKRGFSKSSLAARAAELRMGYVHAQALGCPKQIRHEYRADRDWGRYTRRYLAYLGQQDAALGVLAERVKVERCCLLCFEGDHRFCHRHYVADALARLMGDGLSIIHLAPAVTGTAAWLQPLAGISPL